MSTPAPNVTLNLVDRTTAVPDVVSGIAFVQGITERGPVNDPGRLIFSWPQFLMLHGGYIPESDFPLHCKMMLERGVVLRINGIKKNAVRATANIENISNQTLFTLQSKYPGESYNEMDVTIQDPSDSELGDFNMLIEFNDGEYSERYENLKADEDSINTALARSSWVELESMDVYVEGVDPDLDPKKETVSFTDGADGDTVEDVDFNDFSAFDEYEDTYFLGAPGWDGDLQAHCLAGEAYAASRKDLRFYASIETDHDVNNMISHREDLPYSRWISYSSGGWQILDPVTGNKKEVSELSHFIANGINVTKDQNPWTSFSGPENLVPNVLKPLVNYGGKAKFAELDMLNRNHINMAINRNGVNMFWGNFTAQRENSHTKFISTNNLIIFMNKSLAPVLETFIERPLDIPLFRTIFYTIKPYLDRLVVPGRAIFNYDYKGDQNANSLDELKINDPNDIQDGKYKVILSITRINPLQDFELTIELTRAGVTIQ